MCIFCQIIKKEIPSEIVFEDEELIVFKDVNPSAPVHVLIVPKKHIESLIKITQADRSIIEKMVWRAKILASEFGLDKAGYRLQLNCGRGGGQIVDHIHIHLQGGWKK